MEDKIFLVQKIMNNILTKGKEDHSFCISFVYIIPDLFFNLKILDTNKAAYLYDRQL